jgi:DNA-binding MarR family transcriptional regulator
MTLPPSSTPNRLLTGDDGFRDFIADLFAAAAAMQSLRRGIARWLDIGGTELAILLAVARLGPEGPVGVRRVAEHLHVAAAHITTEVQALERRNLLRKTTSALDSRAVDLALSAEGRSLLQHLSPALDRVNEALFTGVSDDEMARSQDFFRLLIARVPAAFAALTAE